jgi:DNA-binding transcriptional LysR family regulator
LDISDLSLSALVVFEAIYQHKSLTRAAEVLDLSQPAISAALGKLRLRFGDPLFVRSAYGMTPTPRADRLAVPVGQALRILRDGIADGQFVPATSRQRFKIITTDVGEMAFLPKIIRHLERIAPNLSLCTEGIAFPGASDALERGKADLAIGFYPDLERAGYYQQRLFSNASCVVARQNHPHIKGSLTLDQYLQASHVVVRPLGRTPLLDDYLTNARIQRKIFLEIASWTSVPTIIAATDLLATVPASIAAVYAQLVSLQTIDPPFETPSFDIKQYWHERVNAEPAIQWLRQQIALVLGQELVLPRPSFPD